MEELRAWIGSEEIADDIVAPAMVQKFRATLGLVDDREVAPRLIHFCLCQCAVDAAALGPDGHPRRGGFLPPVPLPRRMWAGGDIEFFGDLRVGEAVTRRSRVADVVVKDGRSGTLCFVTVDHAIHRADGSVAVRDRQTIVYRDTATVPPPAAPQPAPEGAVVETVVPSPTLLFRYSALTFNAHRIHYDHRYATQVEGYAGLVVHGPLQATLLIDLATRRGGRAPDRFTFRSLSTIFDTDTLRCHAGPRDGATMRLWTARPGGPVAMQAEATWND